MGHKHSMEVRTVDPDTQAPETEFREQVRDVLGLDWSTRDAAIFAELKRLKERDQELNRAEAGYGHGI